MDRMEAVITRMIPVALVAMLSIATGCQSVRSAKHQVTDAVGITEYSAPSNIQCVWQKQVAYLPNPAHEGEMSPGIVGQVFVWDSNKSAVQAEGELFVKLTDESSKTPLTPEVFHFDPKTLKKLVTSDERWGECFVMFIPLQPGWENVKNIRLQAQFAPKNKMAISDHGQAFAIESGPTNPQGGGIRTNFDRHAARPASMPGMQDMKKFVKQLQDGKNSNIVNVQSTMKANDKRQIVIPATFDTPVAPAAPGPLSPTAPVIIPASNNVPAPVPPPAPAPAIPAVSPAPVPAMPVPTRTHAPTPVITSPVSDHPPVVIPASLSLPAGAGDFKDTSGLPTIALPEAK